MKSMPWNVPRKSWSKDTLWFTLCWPYFLLCFCSPVYAGRDLVMLTICACVCVCVCVCVCLSASVPLCFRDTFCGHHLYNSLKSCTRPDVLTLTFFQGHENLEFVTNYTMNGDHFVDSIAHWTIWHWPSIMVSTVSYDDEVVHKTCCFDLNLFPRSWKLRIFLTLYHERGSLCGHHNSLNRLTLTFNHGFDS